MSPTPPGQPLVPTRSPDAVLIIGATGHIGRLILEQGLEMFGPEVAFRVLLRNMDNADRFSDRVDCRPGDVTDPESLRAACDGFTADSLIFDTCTLIDLSYEDAEGTITATNLEGSRNVIAMAREIGCTLHKAHSMAGLASPREGAITEATPADPANEEDIYATLPYLRCKKQVTADLRDAMGSGQRIMVTYLVTPWGPHSRADSLSNNVIETSLKAGRYYYPRNVGIAYVDARDAAKLHWQAWMLGVHDDVVLSNPLSQEDFAGFFANATGSTMKMNPLGFKMMWVVGKSMDVLKRWIFRRTEFPLSEAIVYLMFANNAYDSAKANQLLGYEPRPAADTFADHFQDLSNRRVIETHLPRRDVSIW